MGRAETAKEAAHSKKQIEELQTNLAEALCRVEETETRENQFGKQLKAAEADTENYRKWSDCLEKEF